MFAGSTPTSLPRVNVNFESFQQFNEEGFFSIHHPVATPKNLRMPKMSKGMSK